MKNGIYKLVYSNGDMTKIVLQGHLANIDCMTSLYENKEKLLEYLGYPKEGELLIVGNNTVKKFIPIVYDNDDIRTVSFSSLGTAAVDTSKKEVVDLRKKINNDFRFRKFLINKGVLDPNIYFKFNRYKQYREFACYYDEYSKEMHIPVCIMFNVATTFRFDEIDEITDFVFDTDKQEFLDEGFVALDKDGKVKFLYEPNDLLEALLVYKDKKLSLKHDPSGMMSGNMVGIDIPEFDPYDGTIIKTNSLKKR